NMDVPQNGLRSHNQELWQSVLDVETAAQAELFHDIFANPFRPITRDVRWFTPRVKALACGIYNDRNFDGMPALGEAFEREGCSNQTMVTHCRGQGAHAGGCWLLDLVLERE